MLGVTSFECTTSVFNITNENNSFSIIILGHWCSKSAGNNTDELNKLLGLRSPKMQVKEIRKRRKKIGDNEYKLSDFDTQKNEILEELKNVKYNDIEDLVYRMQLTNDEGKNIIGIKSLPTKITRYSLNPGVYEVIDLNNSLKFISPDNVKVSVTIDDVRLKSNLKNNQTSIFTEKSSFIQF